MQFKPNIMNTIFPEEIISQTSEGHFAKFNSKTRIVYLLIILLLVVTGVALPFVRVDITHQGRGIIRSTAENNIVSAAIYGEVIKNSLQENLYVTKGDILLKLNTEKLDEEFNSLLVRRSLICDYQRDLEALVDENYAGLQSLLYKKEKEEYLQKLKELDADLNQKKRDYHRNRELFEKKVIAKVEFENIEFVKDQAKRARLLYSKQKLLQWQSTLKELELEKIELETQIAKNEKEKRNYQITAPVSGVITHYAGIEAGNFIAPGQNIAQISPKGDLIVECYITPADIGYIQIGMDVKFQLDAFNYNQWGLASGEVIEISPDIFQNESSSYFKVRCSLNETHLKLKNGYEGKLKKGLSLTARFVVTERSLYQLLYDKVDDWLNPRLKK
jgi:HlyD family secretion protein